MLMMGLTVAASMTVTERAPELETYTRELIGGSIDRVDGVTCAVG
jgi:hypothetical protein